ncbi:FecR family protein [Mucilaginibacter terrae]|uniref:Transmembrane sensor n=1 Tax=Mucilaginibacter terrae TaxID=1955052 RepID=A0ABU3H0W3_9SPHI|nr:FecR domain-containing protein [Mucilaginibacter terrae]MDT3405336.1 transmembrane sensor [Mucilaginibacter terrae]
MPDIQPHYIKKITQKFMQGTISGAEAELLEQWYAQHPQPKPEWFLNNESREELKHRLYNNISKEIKPVKKLYPVWAKIAAAVLIVATAGIAVVKLQQADPIEQYTVSNAPGHVRKVMLPDHSLVWLKGNSSLDYPEQFSDSTRNVTLHGEALFEVSKDRRHPFIISTGNYVTRVLGTSFNISSNNTGAFKLTVLTGKVQVSSTVNKAMQKPVLVMPGKEFEMLSMVALPRVVVSTLDHKDAVVSGTQYPMNFEETGFDEIKRRIEEKFDVTINTVAASYQQCRVSANVTDQSLQNTLKVICAAIGAEYTVNKNIITITGGGCN